MLEFIPLLILLCTLQLSTTASVDAQTCTTSSTCAIGSTCYRGFCVPGLNGVPCNNTRDCVATAQCAGVDPDTICVRNAPCSTSNDCLLHERCLVPVGVCVAGTKGQPCNSSEECLPTNECRNSVCQELLPVEGPPATTNDLAVCFANANSLPTPNLIELPTWLVGAVGFVIAVIASQAPQWIMKPKDVQRRTTIFKVFLASTIVLWVPYFILAVIDQVMIHRRLSNSDNFFQSVGKCFEADSAIYEQLRTGEGLFVKQARFIAIGAFCQVIAAIVFTLATFRLIWRYLQEYPSQKLHVQWKKVILIGLAVVALGLTGIFVGAKIAIEKRQFPNRYCEIVKAFGNEYVTCALSIGNTFEVLDQSFSDEAVDVCSEMTLRGILTGNISSVTTTEEFINLALPFASSLEVAVEVGAYQTFSGILASFYFSIDLPDSVLNRIWLAFLFLKVIFELMLSLLLIRLLYRSQKVTVLTIIIAVLLVICELVVQISISIRRADIEMVVQGIDGAIVCGILISQGSESNGVLNRSLSPDAGDILTAGTTFLFVVIGFKELFTVHSMSNEAVDDQRKSPGTTEYAMEVTLETNDADFN